ncbi:MAG: transglycosylase SLT domain-containing protein [Myxococcota bacterium]|nr:transglycosylase SLT domain-containing protein [Myxococcota bacterium]
MVVKSFGLPLAGALVLGVFSSLGPCTATTPLPPEPPPAPTPEPPPEFSPEELQPWAEGDPRAAAARHLQQGIRAYAEGKFETAVTELDSARTVASIAPNLVAWTLGNALLRLDRPEEAEQAWANIGTGSRQGPRAQLARIQIALDGEDAARALELLEAFPELNSSGPDNRSQLRAELLRSRAFRTRGEADDIALAYAACARAWAHSAGVASVSVEADACLDALEERIPAAARKGLAQAGLRARGLGRAHSNRSVIKLLGEEEKALRKRVTSEPETACRGLLELGRAWHKERKYSESVPRLRWASEHCPEGDERIRAHYLLAQSLQRGGRADEAIEAWRQVTTQWPEHRFADDGLFHRGEIQLRRGDLEEARKSFTELAERFPNGDMVPAGLWGMAWSSIEAGEIEEALNWLALQASAEERGPRHEWVLQARYWTARLHLDQAQQTEDALLRETALSELAELAMDAPFNWYGLLAFWRLEQADRSRAEATAPRVRARIDALRSGPELPESFPYEREFMDHPGATEGIDLLRSGLNKEAQAEIRFALGTKPWTRWNSDTIFLASWILAESGAQNHSHSILRRSFSQGWPSIEPRDRSRWNYAYPTAFRTEITAATKDYSWSHWTFQGLVREESAFSPGIKSWAGAMGLSQLMWATAKGTARKMGLEGITRRGLSDPELNLKIGSYYFNGLHRRWKGHLALAMGSYNAGPGAVKRWVDARGDLPLDAWVETIPFKQTRLYTKHVYASYQTYYALYDEARAPFVPLRVGVVNEAIGAGDPEQPTF